MAEIIHYTEEMLSTWRTNRLGVYTLNMIALAGKVEGVESQLEYVAKALNSRPALEKRAVVHFVKSALKREMGVLHVEGDKKRLTELVSSYNTFMRYAFSGN